MLEGGPCHRFADLGIGQRINRGVGIPGLAFPGQFTAHVLGKNKGEKIPQADIVAAYKKQFGG